MRGMSGQEIIDSGLDAYGGVDYTFDGYTIALSAPDGTSASCYYDGSSIWAETDEFMRK